MLIMYLVFGFQVASSVESFLVLLISSLTFLASISIQMITEDVQDHLRPFHAAVRDRVMIWMHRYHLILNFVEGVNHLFGPVLLIFISQWFITILLTSFFILLDLIDIGKSEVHINIILLFKTLSLHLMLIIGSENMKNKVKFKFKY